MLRRTGGCCHHRRTGICWKLLWVVQPQLGLLTLSWSEHVLESPSNPKNAMKRIALGVGFMPWNTPAVTRGQGRSSIMGAVAMLFLMIVTTPSAQAEGSWCANYSGNGGTNCGFYSFQQCMAAVSGGRRILHAEWILRVSKLSADAHSTLKSDEVARSTKALSARTNSDY